MRFFHYLTGILLSALGFSVSAAPPAIVTQGKGAAIACASCHGMEGAGNSAAGYPALAQMPQAYFTKQIADFKSGTRSNAVMTPIAKAMTPEDAEAAASFYAALPRPQSPSAPADAGMVARGENLAVNGAWDRNLPACFKCHAPGGVGVAPSFPPLAGQHVGYTVSQLQAWKAGKRTNDPLLLMKTVAEKLSDDDMRAVAAYLATLGTQPATAAPTISGPASATPAAVNALPAGATPVSPLTSQAPASGTTANKAPASASQAPLTSTPATKKPTSQEKTK